MPPTAPPQHARHLGRFRLRAIATAVSRLGDALSHHAALAVHGLPLWSHDPGRIDLLTQTRRGSSRNGLHLHPAAGCEVVRVDGVPAVTLARAIVRAALTIGVEARRLVTARPHRSGEQRRTGPATA